MHKEDIRTFLIIIAFYAVLQLCGITCPIKYMTGISCAGCGMTRAWLSVLRLDFASAFAYHPLFLLLLPIIPLYLYRDRFSAAQSRVFCALFIVLFLICYLLRMADPSDTVVVFEPEEGLLWKSFHFILSFAGIDR